MMAFTSPEDLIKSLPKATSNISRAMGGDKITIEIKKSDSSGGISISDKITRIFLLLILFFIL